MFSLALHILQGSSQPGSRTRAKRTRRDRDETKIHGWSQGLEQDQDKEDQNQDRSRTRTRTTAILRLAPEFSWRYPRLPVRVFGSPGDRLSGTSSCPSQPRQLHCLLSLAGSPRTASPAAPWPEGGEGAGAGDEAGAKEAEGEEVVKRDISTTKKSRGTETEKSSQIFQDLCDARW